MKFPKKKLSIVFNTRSIVSTWLGMATWASVFQSTLAVAATAGVTIAVLPAALAAVAVGGGVAAGSYLVMRKVDKNFKS